MSFQSPLLLGKYGNAEELSLKFLFAYCLQSMWSVKAFVQNKDIQGHLRNLKLLENNTDYEPTKG